MSNTPLGVLGPEWADRAAFTIAEVSRLLGLPRSTAFLEAKRGGIPTIRVGKRLIVPREGLEKLLKSAGEAV